MKIFFGMQTFYGSSAKLKGNTPCDEKADALVNERHIQSGGSGDLGVMLPSGFNIHGHIVQKPFPAQVF